MSETTNIEWCDSTGSPWYGCTKVSPGCAHCYAWELANRRMARIFRKAFRLAGFADWETRPVWGDQATRVTSRSFARAARRLDALAGRGLFRQCPGCAWRGVIDGDGMPCPTVGCACEGIDMIVARPRMFPSLMDWLDGMPAGIVSQDGKQLEPAAVRADMLAVIHTTPNLDWLLLTKRPGDWRDRSNDASVSRIATGDFATVEWLDAWYLGTPPANVWIGTTVEDQARADERRETLRAIPAVVHFVSYEPALGSVNWRGWEFLRWLISGGESGTGARPSHPGWHRAARDFCTGHGIAYLFKQWGDFAPHTPRAGGDLGGDLRRGSVVNVRPRESDEIRMPGCVYMACVGKKAAGRLLDGRKWSEFPKISTEAR